VTKQCDNRRNRRCLPTSAAAFLQQRQRSRQTGHLQGQNARDVVNIGKSVVIKGELNGSEDLTIEGHVEGKIELRDHVLTIGPNGKIKAELFAKSVVVLGEVVGNVSATEKVDIRENGSVEGDITSPRVAIAEGAHFRGSVDMAQKAKQVSSGPRPAEVKPQPAPQPVMQQTPQQAQKVVGCSGICAIRNETRRRLRPPPFQTPAS
jgi:cytoskeletal protein CcmA (bactofilin family)